MFRNILKLHMVLLVFCSVTMAMDPDLVGADGLVEATNVKRSKPKPIPKGDPNHPVFPYKEIEYTKVEVLNGLNPLFKDDKIRFQYGIVFGVIFKSKEPKAHRNNKFTDALQRLYGKLRDYDLAKQKEVLACLAKRHKIDESDLGSLDSQLKQELFEIINMKVDYGQEL